MSQTVGMKTMFSISVCRSLSGKLFLFGIHKIARHKLTRKRILGECKNSNEFVFLNFSLLVPFLAYYSFHKRARHILDKTTYTQKSLKVNVGSKNMVCFQFHLVGPILAELCSTLRIRRSTAGALAHHYFPFEVRRGEGTKL